MAIEVIQWKEDTGEDMVWRFPGSDEIKMGAQLIVSESQAAVFFRDGKALDVFGPGRHTLSTMNLPFLTKLMSWPFGFKSPFSAEVYFVSRRVFTNQKWGTREPVIFRDTEFKMVRLRAFGIFSIRTAEPQLFINTMVGTQRRFTTDDVESFLRDIIVSRLNDVLGETLKTLLDLPRYYDELAVALKTRVREDFGKYGLEVVDFLINSITPPEEVQKIIDERSGMAAIGDMGEYMRFKAARAVGDAANQPGGAAGDGMSLGMGAGLGMMLPGMIQQAMQGAQQQQQGQGNPDMTGPICSKCRTQLPPSAQFCNNCGARVASAMVECPSCKAGNAAGSKFCNNCGASMAPATKVCGKCGSELPPAGTKFCSNCGEAVK